MGEGKAMLAEICWAVPRCEPAAAGESFPRGSTEQETDGHHMAKFNPGRYIQEVRQEVSKVTWPTRKETTITTGMVFLMVFLAATFFFVVDLILGGVVRLVLGLGG
jgi:preprotein translocase subunit SecE